VSHWTTRPFPAPAGWGTAPVTSPTMCTPERDRLRTTGVARYYAHYYNTYRDTLLRRRRLRGHLRRTGQSSRQKGVSDLVVAGREAQAYAPQPGA
jgi:hypothetical protein